MQFDSLTFVVFFTLLAALYQLPWGWNARKWLLLVASFVFYGAWSPAFLLLLIGSACVDWWLSLRIAAAASDIAKRRWLTLSIVANLGLLAVFKYGNFLNQNVAALLALGGIQWQPPAFDILLPVGISFYTFQSLSYCIDVYRGQVPVQRSLRDYVLFVAFFPQLVAGPIVRYSEFRDQLEQPRRSSADGFFVGISLMLIGLFQKIVLADSVFAPVADTGFVAGAAPGGALAWSATIAFTGQIFCDFAGYSLCAIGCAATLGFHLPDNFRSPYAAIGFSDFWRRWHISLSSWLRDYLYVPLGGNRGGTLFTARNLMLTMLLGGLWHGAAWTFVAWGAFHGACLIAERAARGALPQAAWRDAHALRWLYGAFTLLMVMWAWVWFRAPDFATAANVHLAMLGRGAADAPAIGTEARIALIVFALLWLAHWATRSLDLRATLSRMPGWLAGLLWGALLTAMVLSPGAGRAFIYFQF
jgi:alginate O-acetyltransferase complex protein AlgI